MKKRVFGLIMLIYLYNSGSAQILISKPYLKITNSISGQVYKIKPDKKIEFKLNNDSILIKDHIEYFSDTNHIAFEKMDPVRIDQISYIRFRPKSKGFRITKLFFYSSWGIAMIIGIYENTNPGNDPNFQSMPFVPVFFIGTAIVIATAEIGESILNLSVQKRELFKNKNLKLEIITK